MIDLKAIRHVGIVVIDLKISLNFWTKIMGFTIYKELNESGIHVDSITGIKNSKVQTIKLIGPKNYMIELLDFKKNDSRKEVTKPYAYGITHIAVEVDNIENIYIELMENGIEFNSKPNLTPDGFAKMNYFKAPDNVYIELVEIMKQ